ncbi:hypothetical protein EAF00_002597 [Botryotinia globosa]|nr:hypothetical protein EAF00_002597 [Botryotinia globosa]
MAVEEGRDDGVDVLRIIRLLVEDGAGSQDLRPALIVAANRGLYHVVRFFVDDCGTDIRSPLDNGLSILCSLNANRRPKLDEQILSFFIEQGVDPNGVPGNAVTPLEEATLKSRLAMVKILLEHGADFNLSGSLDHGSPLYQILQNSWDISKVYEINDSDYLLQLLDLSRKRDCVIQVLLTAGAETGEWPELCSEALLEYNNRQKQREKWNMY